MQSATDCCDGSPFANPPATAMPPAATQLPSEVDYDTALGHLKKCPDCDQGYLSSPVMSDGVRKPENTGRWYRTVSSP